MTAAVKRVLGTGEEKIKVRGFDDLMVFRARCCNPIRGEKIVGYITRGKGVSVHSATCPNVVNLLYDPERRIDVEWDKGIEESRYTVKLTMEVEDRKGLLAAVSARVADINTNIKNMEARTGEDGARIDMTVEISDLKHLEKVIKSLRAVDGVIGVERTEGLDRQDGGRAGLRPTCLPALVRRDRVDLDPHVPGKPGDLNGRARRIRLGKVGAVDLVHRRRVVHVGQEHRRANDVGHRQSAGFEDRGDIVERPPRLNRDVAVDSSPVAGSIGICPARKSRFPARTACEYGPAGLGACGVETGVFTTDVLCGFDDFVRSQAARADANALDAAVDQCPHRLQVRLEPPRADVVRVAVLTPHDRTLSANLATLGHIWCTRI